MDKLFANFKGAGDAAQSTDKEETKKLDTGKLAGAAGDILGATSDYTNMRGTSAGQYVEKAENYLKDYKEKNSTTTAPPATETTTETTTAPPATETTTAPK